MFQGMAGGTKDFEIFRRVVRAIAVSVVDDKNLGAC